MNEEQLDSKCLKLCIEDFLTRSGFYELFRKYEFNDIGEFECKVYCQSNFPYRKAIFHIKL